MLRKLAMFILGIDDTELSDQVNYLKQVAKNKNVKVNKKDLNEFVIDIKDKHDFQYFAFYLDGNLVYADDVKIASKIYENYKKLRVYITKKILMYKDDIWVIVYEKEGYVFIMKMFSKPSEIELEIISKEIIDIYEHLAIKEKELYEKIYEKIDNWV